MPKKSLIDVPLRHGAAIMRTLQDSESRGYPKSGDRYQKQAAANADTRERHYLVNGSESRKHSGEFAKDKKTGKPNDREIAKQIYQYDRARSAQKQGSTASSSAKSAATAAASHGLADLAIASGSRKTFQTGGTKKLEENKPVRVQPKKVGVKQTVSNNTKGILREAFNKENYKPIRMSKKGVKTK